MKQTKSYLLGLAALSTFLATASAADRSYAAGHFALELDGTTGLIQSVEGGDIAGEVVTVAQGTDFLQKKHIGNVKYEEISMRVGASQSKGLYDWISDTLDQKASRKNGAIVAADFNLRARDRGAFEEAVITEITIPAADATSRDPAYLTVKFQPEVLRWTAVKDSKPLNVETRKQKQWLVSNFRLNIPGVEANRVTKVDAFTIKQKVAEQAVGEIREPQILPTKIEFPNLRVTVPAAQAEGWLKWSDTYLFNGTATDKDEKEGTLTFLTPDLSEELVRITLHHVGVARVHRSLSEAKGGIATITFDLYVESMEIDFMAQFEK